MAYKTKDRSIGTVLVAKDADSAAKLKKRTLTNLDNERPGWLANAHARLDEAVCAAYGWPADLADDETLAQNVGRVGLHEISPPARTAGPRD